MKVYIAGPFFNPEQISLIRAIENIFMGAGVEFISPRLQHGDRPVPKVENAAQAEEIFVRNLRDMMQADVLLAVMDYLLPVNHELHITEWFQDQLQIVSPPLRLPDTGTVFELGYFFRTCKPVILFTSRDPGKARLNLMLACATDGCVYGLNNLRVSLEEERFPSNLPKYSGAYV